MRSGNLDVSNLPDGGMDVPSRGIHALSLEAGDTGLSTLLILRELMELMSHNLGEDVGTQFDLHPHEVFDLIAGSGTGGIAALLVGHLRLPVSAAIHLYCDRLAPLLFEPFPTSSDEKHAATLALEAAMQEIVANITTSADLQLQEPTSPTSSCKTFVLGLSPINMKYGIRLRTYRSKCNESPNASIWQAMRATTSNRDRFLDIRIFPVITIVLTLERITAAVTLLRRCLT
ncbi:hypothetical protein DL96DRAFT_427971, partial [Flagelloscypha sp. PMI_526]